MTHSSVESLIIPGYDTLPAEVKAAFETSVPGRKFIQYVWSNLDISQELDSSSSIWSRITGLDKSMQQYMQSLLLTVKQDLLDEISDTEEYKTILMHLTQQLLAKEMEYFKFLSKEQQELLSKTEFAQQLLHEVNALEQLIEEEQQELARQGLWSNWGISRLFGSASSHGDDGLDYRRKEIINLWKEQFQKNPNLNSMRQTIKANIELQRQSEIARKLALLQDHANQLSAYFPLLNYRKFVTDKPVIEQLRAQYLSDNGEITTEADKLEEEKLADLLFFCMQQVSQSDINFVNLDAFNKNMASQLALEILKAFNNKSELDLGNWFKSYNKNLLDQVITQLQLINGKNWESRTGGLKEEIYSSLSSLWNNKAVNKMNDFMRKMADAHGFIQATNFSTQNESSFLAILDMYNYARHHEQISETRSIITNLLSPLLPLYNEYKDIAFYEKNLYWKLFRMVMPIVMIVASIIVISVALAPLALPELAATAAFIPSLFVGLGASNLYVSVKNEIYKTLRETYYGGTFEIPEYQVNPRMLRAFGNSENANKVRIYYIEALKNCDALDIEFSLKHEQGVLTDEDIIKRKENITKMQALSLEWYDIHSNIDLSFQQASTIFLDRLQQETEKEYKNLINTVQEEFDSIKHSISEVIVDLKTTIEKRNKASVNETNAEAPAKTIKANYRYGLFKSLKCLNTRAHVEELDNFREQISRAASMA